MSYTHAVTCYGSSVVAARPILATLPGMFDAFRAATPAAAPLARKRFCSLDPTARSCGWMIKLNHRFPAMHPSPRAMCSAGIRILDRPSCSMIVSVNTGLIPDSHAVHINLSGLPGSFCLLLHNWTLSLLLLNCKICPGIPRGLFY